MKTPYSKKEIVAGGFLFFGFGLIILGSVLVGGGRDWLQSYTNYFALYKEGYGLVPGVKVKFLRTDVGRITRLELTDNNQVKIYMAIFSEFANRIKGDSRADVKSPTLIGSEYIDIVPGSKESLPIPANGQISARDPKTIDDILMSLQLETKLRQFEEIMENVNSLTYQLQDPAGPFLGTLEDVHHITTQVAGGEGSLGSLISRDEAYQEIVGLLRDLKSVSQSLSETAASLNKDLPDLTRQVDIILKEVEQGTRSFPEVARGAREGLRDVNQVLDSAKRNILIRGNLTTDEPPEGLSRPARDH